MMIMSRLDIKIIMEQFVSGKKDYKKCISIIA